MVKKEDDIAYEIEIERSEEMEQEIDNHDCSVFSWYCGICTGTGSVF